MEIHNGLSATGGMQVSFSLGAKIHVWNQVCRREAEVRKKIDGYIRPSRCLVLEEMHACSSSPTNVTMQAGRYIKARRQAVKVPYIYMTDLSLTTLLLFHHHIIIHLPLGQQCAAAWVGRFKAYWEKGMV